MRPLVSPKAINEPHNLPAVPQFRIHLGMKVTAKYLRCKTMAHLLLKSVVFAFMFHRKFHPSYHCHWPATERILRSVMFYGLFSSFFYHPKRNSCWNFFARFFCFFIWGWVFLIPVLSSFIVCCFVLCLDMVFSADWGWFSQAENNLLIQLSIHQPPIALSLLRLF